MGGIVFRRIVFPIFVGISVSLFFSSSTLTQLREKRQKADKPKISVSSLRDVVVSTQLNGVKVELKTDGIIPDFNSFRLNNPPRLVLDFPGMSNASPRKNIAVDSPLLKDVRIGQHTDKMRVVFTFPGEEVLQHRITRESQNLGVFIGQFTEEKESEEKPPEAKIQEPIRPPGEEPESEIKKPESSVSPPLPALAPAPTDVPRSEDKKLSPAVEAEPERPKANIGAKISLDFMNADIREVFRLIGNAAQKKIIPSDEVGGMISLRLIDTPWDQALDVILDTRNLKKIEVENVILIIPAEKMLKEKEETKD